MRKYQLVRVIEVDQYVGQTEEYKYLSTTQDWKIGGKPGDKTVVVAAGDATLDELVDYCDSDAEGANRHEFVGCHAWLGYAIKEFGGEEAALKVMRLIAEYGGLTELSNDTAAR